MPQLPSKKDRSELPATLDSDYTALELKPFKVVIYNKPIKMAYLFLIDVGRLHRIPNYIEHT